MSNAAGMENRQITFDSCQENQQLVYDMLASARRHIRLYTADLEAMTYSHRQCIALLENAIRSNPAIKIQVIICQPRFAVSKQHLWIEFARRFTSFVEVRQPEEKYCKYGGSILLIDNKSYLKKRDTSRFSGIVNRADPLYCQQIIKEFTVIWESAETAQEFRRLNI